MTPALLFSPAAPHTRRMDDVPTILDTVIRAIARVQKKRYTTAKDIEELAATLKEAGRRLDDIAWRKARARAERS